MKKQLFTLGMCSLSFFAQAQLLYSNFDSGQLNTVFGAKWIPIHNPKSIVRTTVDSSGFQSERSASVYWQLNNEEEGGSYASLFSCVDTSCLPQDLSAQLGIRFYAKGKGFFFIALPTTATAEAYNHYYSNVQLSEEWTLYEIPFGSFSQLYGDYVTFDPETIRIVQLTFFGGDGDSGEFQFDQMEFYKNGEQLIVSNPIVPTPKVNQVGYYPLSEKYFTITHPYAEVGESFTILDENDQVAYTGTIAPQLFNDSLSTGEKVLKGYFTSFTQAGNYRVHVRDLYSPVFKIEEGVYRKVWRDATRSFYLNRSGMAINDLETGMVRAAGHLGDTLLRGVSGSKDFTGAWYNAGDYGKWVNLDAIVVSLLMWQYELNPQGVKDLSLNLPESTSNGVDVLHEVRWGLEWMLKMQLADGTVLHKVDSEPYFATGRRPDQDSLVRYATFNNSTDVQTPSSIDAGCFVAAMLQAHRVFKQVDTAFSNRCLKAALRAWTWLEKHPSNGQTDPFYGDADATEEVLWAKAEMLRHTGDVSLQLAMTTALQGRSVKELSWSQPDFLAWLTLFQWTDGGLSSQIKSQFQKTADRYDQKGTANGYGIGMDPEEYWWESNEFVANKGNLEWVTYWMTGNEKYKNSALRFLHYLLGLNSLNVSFVTKNGTNPIQHPYHWYYFSDRQIVPGWMAGGPNQYKQLADPLLTNVIEKGTPPAKCYVDEATLNGSWASNEAELTQIAALSFLVGMLEAPLSPLAVDEDRALENRAPFRAWIANRHLFLDGAKENSPLQVSLYDLQGRLQYKQQLLVGSVDRVIALPILSNGMYLLEIQESSTTQTLRIWAD